jgi:hypothetical protein
VRLGDLLENMSPERRQAKALSVEGRLGALDDIGETRAMIMTRRSEPGRRRR